MKLDMVFTDFLMSPIEGAFFIDAITDWGSLVRNDRSGELWCILDAPRIGGLYLDLRHGGLLYFVDNGPEVFVSLRHFPAGKQPLRAVVSYDSNRGVGIFLGHGFPRKWIDTTWTAADSNLNTRVTPWRGRKGNFGAGVEVRTMAGFAKSTSERASNNLLRGEHPPLPAERLELEELVKRIYY